MKKVPLTILIAVAMICITSLPACSSGGTSSGTHTHVFTAVEVEPDCENEGYTLYTCTCGYEYKEEIIPPAGHVYADGVCTVCGAYAPTEGLAYTLSADGSYYICTGIGTATTEGLSIPDSYENLPVREVADGAFRGSTAFSELIIPDSVTSIGESAFENCLKLKCAKIGSGLSHIGKYAFLGCPLLEEACFAVTSGWSCYAVSTGTILLPSGNLKQEDIAAEYISSRYASHIWKRS